MIKPYKRELYPPIDLVIKYRIIPESPRKGPKGIILSNVFNVKNPVDRKGEAFRERSRELSILIMLLLSK